MRVHRGSPIALAAALALSVTMGPSCGSGDAAKKDDPKPTEGGAQGGAVQDGKKSAYAYPSTKEVDHVDDYHGTKVKDPFRWLEDPDSAETKAWVEAENKVTFEYLG